MVFREAWRFHREISSAGLAPVERRKPFGAKKLAHRAYPGRGEQGKPLSLRAIAVIACGAKQSRRH
jgi:hypothetical protein